MISLILGIFIGFIFGCLVSKIIEKKFEFKKITNKNRDTSERDTYWLLSVENDDYLFTDDQLNVAKNRALKNPEDVQ